MKFKIKNLLMHWFILTPIAAVDSLLAFALISSLTNENSDLFTMGDGTALFIVPALVVAACFALTKIYLKLRGASIDFEYYDNNYEFEVARDYSGNLWYRQTRGGWSHQYKIIVWIALLFSPVIIVFQLVADIFAFIALFIRPMFSWYGVVDYDELSFSFLQRILHFLFGIIILG